MQYHARSCNIMLSSCIEYVLSMWLENLRRRLSIHFLQHLGGFLHPGDLNVSGVATQRHGKHGGAAAARPRICAPCRWPPASDLSFEKIWLTYYVLLCIIIWSSYDLLWDYIICDWFCSVVYDLISFENCWGAHKLQRYLQTSPKSPSNVHLGPSAAARPISTAKGQVWQTFPGHKQLVRRQGWRNGKMMKNTTRTTET